MPATVNDWEIVRALVDSSSRFRRLQFLKLRRAYGLDDRFTRLRRRCLLTQEEMAGLVGVSVPTVKQWRCAELLRAEVYNDKGACLCMSRPATTPRRSAKGHHSELATVSSSPNVHMRCSAMRKPSPVVSGRAAG